MNIASSRCFVLGCPNSEENTTNATFYEFPGELQEEWLIAIGRSKDTFIIDELVCSDHFENTDFKDGDTIRTLQENAIPTLNLPITESEESSLILNAQLNTSTYEEIEQLVQKYNSFEKSKPVKVSSNAFCTVLKPGIDKTYKCETAPLNSINVILITGETEEQPHDLSPEHTPGVSEYDSGEECPSKYDDILNCRTCLDEIGPEEGYLVIDIYHNGKTLKEMIVYCIPQMISTLLDTDLVCSKCLESIKFCMNFIENCLKVEAELLESHNDHITATINDNNLNESDENDTPEIYRHISLDHNYIPNTTLGVIEKSSKDDTQKSFEGRIINDASTLKHECLKCDRTFKTKNYLLDHIRRVHSSGDKSEKYKKKTCVFDCDFCNKSFLTKLGYDLHLQLSHREQVEKKKESAGYTCKECGSRFTMSDSLTEHKQEDHGFTCRICSLKFDTRTELNVHSDIHPNSHLCHMCGKGFKNKAILKAHMLTHNDPNTHLCHVCGQGFKSQVSLSLHFKHHNPDLKFQCDQCPSTFQQRYRLDLHKKVRHLGTREYKCTACDKKFSYKANLKSHYRLKHSEVKPYQCERCGVRFARSDYLRRHTNCGDKSKRRSFTSHKRKYRYKRGDPALITCKLCDKVFKDVQMLRLHVKTHTKLRKYKCNTCNLTFTTSSNRDRHEVVHRDSLFRCEVCFKRMKTQEALDEHCLMSHENSKKYKCHVCEELFGRKYLLHSHVAERHGNVEDFEKEKEVLYKVVMQDYLVDN